MTTRDEERKLGRAPTVPSLPVHGEHFHLALLELALANHEDFDATLRTLLEKDSRTTKVERVSYWSLQAEPEAISCEALYRRAQHAFERGAVLGAAAFPRYFAALREGGVIAADDAMTHPATREFADAYLPQAGITSMLDVPIYARGRLVGVLCHEHVGAARKWTTDEKQFAMALSHILSLAIESRERSRAEDALRESESRLRTLLEALPSAVLVVTTDDGVCLYANTHAGALSGLRPEEALGRPSRDFYARPAERAALLAELRSTGRVRARPVRLRRASGASYPALVSIEPLTFDGKPALVAVINDTSELEKAQSALAMSEARLEKILEASLDAVVTMDALGYVEMWNASAERLFGLPREKAVGQPFTEVALAPHERAKVEEGLAGFLAGHAWTLINRRSVITALRADGREFPAELAFVPIHAAGTHSFTAFIRDVTQQVREEAELRHFAYHDVLTGLPNRALLGDILARELARVHRSPEQRFALLFLDLDGFKEINDSYGHKAGDELLVTVARRIRGALRATDVAARLGGDEFTVLLAETSDPTQATTLAGRILAALAEPISLRGAVVRVTASIGIALADPRHHTPEDLLRDADAAMYHAKEAGRNRAALFEPGLHARAEWRARLREDLGRAIAERQLRILYQPVFSLKDGRIRGFEALVRWQRAPGELLLPDAFVPIAEETAEIQRIDAWVLENACRQGAEWARRYPDPALSMSVNLSIETFGSTELAGVVEAAVRRSGLPEAQLVLELHEGVVVENVEQVTRLLRAMPGVKCIDDFGSGHSSLTRLSRLPVHALKLVPSLVLDAEQGAALRAVVALARELGLRVMAKGIESKEQLARAREMGCELGQGWALAEPLEPVRAEALLARGHVVTLPPPR